MKMLKILKGSIVAFAVLLLTAFSQQANAQQFNLIPATVDLNQQEFQAAHAYGVVPVLQLSTVQFIGNGVGTGTGPGWPPPLDPPCDEQMTPELAQHMLDLANQYCRPMYICVQGSNCAWYLYVFKPTNPNCFYNIQYQSTLQCFTM